MKRSGFAGWNAFGLLLLSTLVPILLFSCGTKGAGSGPQLSPEETRAIAKEAYVYGFPIVDSYRIMHSYLVERGGPEYKGDWNQIHNNARLMTPADKSVQTPNADTPYSFLGVDLRAEPLVLTFPAIEQGRYFSAQFIDLYTFNFAYVGSRATGNGGGSYLLAGPDWKGDVPKGIKSVIHCETELALIVYRTQLFKPSDMENVKKIQAGYKVQPLSAFLGTTPPAAAAPIAFAQPISRGDEQTSLDFFRVLNFALQFCPVDSSETALRARFATLGITGGAAFDTTAMSPATRLAIHQGIADAWQVLADVKKQMDERKLTSMDVFGTRAFLRNNYAYRMAAAVLGIYGNSKEEAIYPVYAIDSDGHYLDGSSGRYELRLMPRQFPPVNAFWSITMYQMPASLLVENPLRRYLINSSMVPTLKRDADGGVTLYLQHSSPGADKESNWLPAPAGPFAAAMRMYWPKPAAYDGTWKVPPLMKVK
jgi:hypothetical protein